MNRFWIFFACSLVLHLAVAALLVSRTALYGGLKSQESGGEGEEVQIHTEQAPFEAEGLPPAGDLSPPSETKWDETKEVSKPAPSPKKSPPPRPQASKKPLKPKQKPAPPPVKKQKPRPQAPPPPAKTLKSPSVPSVDKKADLPSAPPASDTEEVLDTKEEADISPPPPVLSPPPQKASSQEQKNPPDPETEEEELIDPDEILKEEALPSALPSVKPPEATLPVEPPPPPSEEGEEVLDEDRDPVPLKQTSPPAKDSSSSSVPSAPKAGQNPRPPSQLSAPAGGGKVPGGKAGKGSPAAAEGGFEPSRARGYRQLVQMPGNPLPEYPLVALEKKWEGRVEVVYYVNTAGLVEKIQIYRSSSHLVLDNSALQALARYRYKPGQEGWVSHPVDFVLDQHKEVQITTPLRTK